jgi:hypothetical protein
MPHLPNEIWLLIASYCEPQDLWLTLRPVNNQLQQCTEQYFRRDVLPHATLVLPVVIPTYDARMPIRGKVIFNPISPDSHAASEGDLERVTYNMEDTEPAYYLPRFLLRWATMHDRECGELDERIRRWELELGGQCHSVSLHGSTAVKQGCVGREVRVSFDWRYLMTSFFRASLLL